MNTACVMKNKTIVSLLTLCTATPLLAVNYTGGHADIGIEYDTIGGSFEFEAHAGEGGSQVTLDGYQAATEDFFEPTDFTIFVPQRSGQTFFNNQTIPELSLTNGDPIWYLPLVNYSDPTIPFFGLSTEELGDAVGAGFFIGETVTWTIGTVTSPSGTGTFTMWDDSGANDIFWVNSSNAGLTALNNDFPQALGEHSHLNMGFSELGTWTVEFVASAERVSDSATITGSGTYTFQVIPEPSTYGLMFGAAALMIAIVRRRMS